MACTPQSKASRVSVVIPQHLVRLLIKFIELGSPIPRSSHRRLLHSRLKSRSQFVSCQKPLLLSRTATKLLRSPGHLRPLTVTTYMVMKILPMKTLWRIGMVLTTSQTTTTTMTVMTPLRMTTALKTDLTITMANPGMSGVVHLRVMITVLVGVLVN